MKNFIALLTLILPLFLNGAIDSIKPNTSITDVTVFFSGAEVTRSSKLNLIAGKHLILIQKLPQEINPQSIQVKQIKNSRILSVKHQLDYTKASKKSKREKEIEDEIEKENRRYQDIRNQAQVFDLEENLLMKNTDFTKKESGSTLAEVKEAAAFYRLKLNEIRAEKLKLQDEVDKINERIQELYEEFNEVTTEKRQRYSQIMIAVDCDKQTNADLIISYYISSAGWTPMYDFRVENISTPLSIVYNANVFQSSGEDWKNVDITLSTNNPSLSGDRPEIERWYLNRPSPYIVESAIKEGIGGIKGRVLDAATGEPLPFANVSIELNGENVGGSTTDFDGLYAIKPIPSGRYTVRASYVGYSEKMLQNIVISADDITHLDMTLDQGGIALESVQIVEYAEPLIDHGDFNPVGAQKVYREEINRLPARSVQNATSIRGGRGSANETFVDGIKVRGNSSSNYIDNSIRTAVANMEYKIEIPYTIPSDGEDYNLKIKEVTTPAEYIFYAVPKLEKEAFLTAHIANWTELNLLSGTSNIFYQGTYVAESYVDANLAKDTMEISLGRDGNIVVTREGNKNKNEKSFSGNYVKEKFAWDISVKNNRDASVKLIVEDQYPLTEWKSVEITLLESEGSIINDKTGLIKWEFELPAGSKKDLSFLYMVKYNKGANLSLE